ncbi:MAG: phytanoyl-CoA dioxygenase [Rhodospirillaceae bacterium]|nr:phytanoyl-CoA dioxygenase [Rhodospirillaceae bacterium]
MTEQAAPSTGPTRAEHTAQMAEYLVEGESRSRALGSRGPVRFGADGKLHPDILEAYWKNGFYVFEGVIDAEELAELRADANTMIERAPMPPGSDLDAKGRPALGRDYAREPYTFIKPLSDPWGGTDKMNGRHPTQMIQPEAEDDAPDHVVFLMHGMCMAMPAGLRLYGHQDLLGVAQSINGEDFVPYTDSIFVKQPGVGGSVSWHQDGVTHWDSPDWDEGIHGFNFQVQLYRTTPANCLWVVPGTHKQGRIDIRLAVADNGGKDTLANAVPLICEPGGVTVVNRQMLHGSFANTSPDMRLSLTIGFHRHKSVVGQIGALSMRGQGAYDEKRIFERSSVIQVAIDARHQHRPNEAPFAYQPFVGKEDAFRFNDETRERVIRDYNTKDLAI